MSSIKTTRLKREKKQTQRLKPHKHAMEDFLLLYDNAFSLMTFFFFVSSVQFTFQIE